MPTLKTGILGIPKFIPFAIASFLFQTAKDIWYHIAAVSGSKTGLQLYINGALVEGDPFIRKHTKIDDGIHDPEYKWVSDTLATATLPETQQSSSPNDGRPGREISSPGLNE